MKSPYFVQADEEADKIRQERLAAYEAKKSKSKIRFKENYSVNNVLLSFLSNCCSFICKNDAEVCKNDICNYIQITY